jgi:hypothetical protein
LSHGKERGVSTNVKSIACLSVVSEMPSFDAACSAFVTFAFYMNMRHRALVRAGSRQPVLSPVLVMLIRTVPNGLQGRSVRRASRRRSPHMRHGVALIGGSKSRATVACQLVNSQAPEVLD